MLGALAAIAMIVGGVSSTVALTEDQRLAAEETRGPVIEVQATKTVAVDSRG
jgi:hypothetical protein